MSPLPSDPCPEPSVHGNPFRYCPYCSWIEPVAEVIVEEALDDREHGDPVTLAPARPAYLEPTVGRIVHYQQWNSPEPLAAIITAVLDDDRVNLAVYQKSGMSDPRPSAPFAETPEDGHWNWPPRS